MKPAPRTPRSRAARGSVLIFVVVLLSVLALLATTTLFVVRQGVKVSQNAAQSVESKLSADTGLRHATKVLRDSVSTFTIYTPEGVFAPNNGDAPNHPWLRLTEGMVGAPPYASPLKIFADDDPPAELESVPLSALDSELVNFAGQRFPELRFTSSPILSRIRDQYDYALVNDVLGETPTFYKGADNPKASAFLPKTLPRIGSVRGQYFVWVKDLDAKLYAKSDGADGWDLDVHRTLTDTLYSSFHPTATDETEWAHEIRRSILNYDDGPYPLLEDAAMLDELWSLAPGAQPGFDPRAPHYHSMKELATQLVTLYDTAADPVQLTDPDTYSPLRAELEHNFTVYRDVFNLTGPLQQKRVKDHPTAVNVNTAPVEIIAAALSQIPGENNLNDPDLHDPIEPARALAIAQRIVSKRPFLCRMDFEDFLAAHIRGAYDNSLGIVDLLHEPDDPDLTTPVEADFATLSGGLPIVRMLSYALRRRLGPGYTPADTAINAHALTDQTLYQAQPELSLSQYLEVPGVTTLNAQHLKMVVGGTEWWPNEPRYQIARWEFFFNNTQGSDLTALRTPALITPREFNNIANSLFGGSDDIQNVQVGQTTNQPVVLAGSDGTLQTTPQGDDRFLDRILPGTDTVLQSVPAGDDFLNGGAIVPGANGVLDTAPAGDDVRNTDYTTIYAGPNGIADTFASSARPSFYSFIDDVKFAEQFWDAVDAVLPAPPAPGAAATHVQDSSLAALSVTVPAFGVMTMPDADRLASRAMRFYYRSPLVPTNGTSMPYVDPDVFLSHLVTWRCNPSGMPPANPIINPDFESDQRSSFYQMTFDEWTSFTTATTRLYGPMQCTGDPDIYPFGVDDTDDFAMYYSAAKPWSGNTPGRPIDVDRSSSIDAGIEDAVGNGDVSWSPKFAFRSRYFHVFVLGQGMSGPGLGDPTTTAAELQDKIDKERSTAKPQGQKRIEAVYDALLDQILWQRSPVTDKRAMGEPVP